MAACVDVEAAGVVVVCAIVVVAADDVVVATRSQRGAFKDFLTPENYSPKSPRLHNCHTRTICSHTSPFAGIHARVCQHRKSHCGSPHLTVVISSIPQPHTV